MAGTDLLDIQRYLSDMGLSDYESFAYSALLTHGTSTAKKVSTNADVPQSRIYDVLDRLETKGFVRVQEGRPKKYGPVNPERAMDQYCQYKTQQFDEKLDQTREVGQRLIEEANHTLLREDTGGEMDVGWYYTDREHIREEMRSLCKNAESEILMITTPYGVKRLTNHHLEEFVNCADDGVSIRIVLSRDSSLHPRIYDSVRSWASVRFVDEIWGKIYMYDHQEVVMAYPTENTKEDVGFNTRSKHLYRTLSCFFELLWREGETEPPVPGKVVE